MDALQSVAHRRFACLRTAASPPFAYPSLMLALARQLSPFFRTCRFAENRLVARRASSSPSQLQIASLPPPQRINEIHKALILTHCF